MSKDSIKEMKKLLKDSDFELAHIKADEILCTVLIDKGEVELVELFRKLKKHYS